MSEDETHEALKAFHPAVRDWVERSFREPTDAQKLGWPVIASGASVLLSAPTGSGKTLTAFLWCLDRLMFGPAPSGKGARVLYVSPLKALAVDVERNLRAPLAGITNVARERALTVTTPSIFVRTGDTPQRERASFRRDPADIIITTPESLFLILTSQARQTLRTIDTVIIDEIHALVGSKRGAHLALSLERLERIADQPIQRIGLSATQRPLTEVARFLGGAIPREGRAQPEPADEERLVEDEFAFEEPVEYRPVSIIDTGESKKLEITIEVPVEDMARIGEPVEIQSGPAAAPTARTSIWPAIHPKLVELIGRHRSTLIFVNSRRLAERLAGALNELAGERIAYAHHGSLSRTQRSEIEDSLKSGDLPALVATSSLELGIDMGAIDLVIQIEAPPSVSAGMQRIGRAGHQVGAVSSGIIFPKYRGDLVSCTAVSLAMQSGAIEPSRYPRNPLDVLAQQIVAMTALDDWHVDALFDAIRCAAPYAELRRGIFEGVLDLLSGVYPSDDFAELRPRINWDRLSGMISGRKGAQRVAIANAGTIPDRGLYGVFMAGATGPSSRVGELDEEMVFEASPGETFVLGASTWRIEDITFDRVIVSPAPGEPGKMPFWHGESADRSVELGRSIGALLEQVRTDRKRTTLAEISRGAGLDPIAVENLFRYVEDQAASGSDVPTDRRIVIERSPDELGDWRICVLSPWGGRVHAPWAMGVMARMRSEHGIEVESMWTDDGFVVRVPESDDPPPAELFLPDPEEIRHLVTMQLGSTSLFAARFRENASRALLLPRRRAGQRTPLWQQRKRSADLLSVAASFPSFPMLLETYRECLLDIFDLPALEEILTKIRSRAIAVSTVDLVESSPFASSLLFRYVANYIYDGDAPLAERRAQALTIDPAQLRELIGDIDLRTLLDPDVIFAYEQRLQRLEPRARLDSTDALHDLLLHLGDLSRDEIETRNESDPAGPLVDELIRNRRAVALRMGGEQRIVPVELASRYRDALGVPLPAGLPERLLESADDPIGDLALRFARTHPPFTATELAGRLGVGIQTARQTLERLAREGRLIEGEFTPGRSGHEYCHRDVLAALRHRSLARLRQEAEPVEPEALGRFAIAWHGIRNRGYGLDSVLDAIEQLQGAPLPASILESEILPSRIAEYSPSDLDTLAAAGEVVWAGLEPLSASDGRVALFLADHFPLLFSPSSEELDPEEERIITLLSQRGALHFSDLHRAVGGFPEETVERIWDLVWKGRLTNDSFHALRSWVRRGDKQRRGRGRTGFRSRRSGPAGAEGRWTLVSPSGVDPTERANARVNQLLDRFGILTRDAAALEKIPGGFSAIYPVLRSMEDAGRIRRGYFVENVAATQFARPGAIDRLRAVRGAEEDDVAVLSSVDPANPYGAFLPWPDSPEGKRPARVVGSRVIIVDGALGAYVYRGLRQILTFMPEDEPERSRVGRGVAEGLIRTLDQTLRRAILIETIDGLDAPRHPVASYLLEAGFVNTPNGLQLRRVHA